MRVALPLLLALSALTVRAQGPSRTPMGRATYLREACRQCHETGGTRRTGPVLGAGRPSRSPGWHLAHFYAPRTVSPDSSMPAYPRHFRPHPNAPGVAALIGRYDTADGSMDDDGIVTRREFERAGGSDWKQVLQRLDTGNGVVAAADAAPVPSRALTALIGYLGTLGAGPPPAYRPPREPKPVDVPASIARGEALFLRHCAGCHGERADGNGPAAPFFGDFPPRNFLRGEYRYRSTLVPEAPADEDLFETIRRGVGPSMPAWPRFGDAQVWDLVAFLKSHHPGYLPRELRVEDGAGAVVARFDRESEHAEGATLPGGRVQKRAGRWFLDGAEITDGMRAGSLVFRLGDAVHDWLPAFEPRPIEVGEAPFAFSDASAEVGRKVYAELGCANCHGPEGRGDGKAAANARGSLGQVILPADYTRGLKAGRDARRLVRTFLTGLHGTTMPAYGPEFPPVQAAPADAAPWHLAHFVLRQARR